MKEERRGRMKEGRKEEKEEEKKGGRGKKGKEKEIESEGKKALAFFFPISTHSLPSEL